MATEQEFEKALKTAFSDLKEIKRLVGYIVNYGHRAVQPVKSSSAALILNPDSHRKVSQAAKDAQKHWQRFKAQSLLIISMLQSASYDESRKLHAHEGKETRQIHIDTLSGMLRFFEPRLDRFVVDVQNGERLLATHKIDLRIEIYHPIIGFDRVLYRIAEQTAPGAMRSAIQGPKQLNAFQKTHNTDRAWDQKHKDARHMHELREALKMAALRAFETIKGGNLLSQGKISLDSPEARRMVEHQRNLLVSVDHIKAAIVSLPQNTQTDPILNELDRLPRVLQTALSAAENASRRHQPYSFDPQGAGKAWERAFSAIEHAYLPRQHALKRWLSGRLNLSKMKYA